MNWKLSAPILFIGSMFSGNPADKKLFRDLDPTKFKTVRGVSRMLVHGFDRVPTVTRTLSLKGQKLFSISGIEAIEDIDSVTHLNLTDNCLMGLHLGNFKSDSLRTLVLINNNISTVSLRGLSDLKNRFPNLDNLNLRENKLTGESKVALRSFRENYRAYWDDE